MICPRIDWAATRCTAAFCAGAPARPNIVAIAMQAIESSPVGMSGAPIVRIVTAVKQTAAVRTLASLYFRPKRETMKPPSTSPTSWATSSMGASTAPICASSMP